jgi:hypothetical protein
MRHFSSHIGLLFTLAGCSNAPDEKPDYGNDTGTVDTGENSDFYPGATPYTEGTPRLSIGIFYEGGASETIEVDDITTHYYIYADESSGNTTYTSFQDSQDRTEGLSCDVIVHSGGEWWGGGVHWDTSQDLSAWSQLNLSVRSVDSGFLATDLAMQSEGGGEGRVSLQDYGFTTDDEWHNLQIPTLDLQNLGLDLSTVIAPLILVAEGGNNGSELRVDDVYFSSP